MENASLYIHIPFCASFCDYCDFYSVLLKNNDDEYIDAFISALITDIKHQIDFFEVNDITTVYIGGGTPSVIGKKIGILFDALNKLPRFSPLEFTVETNPESLTEDFISVCRDSGINRLSLGVQTFHEPSCAAVNRGHSGIKIEDKLNLAAKYFPESFSVDLIIGLPFQNEQTMQKDIKTALDAEPAHVSLYSLTEEDNTPLKEKIKSKIVTLPESETADSLWLSARDFLLEAGFCHYEVSNFAKDGKECVHNIRYWQMQNWLGAGPSASGTIINEKQAAAKRFTYANDIDTYIKSPRISCAVYEQLDRNMLMRECLLMGFRQKDGPNPELFKQRFGCSIEDCLPKTMERWKEKEKILFLNQFLLDAFMELENRSR
ncbi:MAG: radical SAM family heme chaperone HemW [Treponema sp.]|nr:radical SAM family heme chaperone HemW [Treponema sp.]